MLDVEAAWNAHAKELLYWLRAQKVEDPDGMCADVFLKAVEASPQYQERGKLRGWLYRIAKCKVIDERRRGNRRPCNVSLAEAHSIVPGPDDAVIEHLAAVELLQALDLTPAQQAVLYWRFGHDLQLCETAVVLGTTIGAVKALQCRALAKLQARYE